MIRLRLLLIAVVLAGCGGATPTAVPTTPPASALAAGAERSFDMADRRPLLLSPDGRWLAARTDNSSLCVFDAATLDSKSCSSYSGIDPASLAWSPDGSRIAWTENWMRNLQESDIWVMDIANGTSTNLTDDGIGGNLMGDEAKQATVDMVPAWTADGSALLFARTDAGRSGTALYRVAAAGGAPERVASLSTIIFALMYRPFVLPGGDVLYSITLPDRDDPQNGVWRMKADGSEPRQLAKTRSEGEAAGAQPVAVAVAGGHALLLYPELLGRFVRDQSPYGLLALDSGVETPLKQPQPGAENPLGEFFPPTAATLSPDGSKVLYVYRRTTSDETVLAVSEVGSADEHVLKVFSDPEQAIVGDSPVGLGLDWGANNLIYGTARPPRGTLIQLDVAAGK